MLGAAHALWLNYTTLHYTTLHYTTLHYTTVNQRIDNKHTDRLEVKMLGGQHAGTSYRRVDRPKKSVLKCQKAIEYLF